MHTCVLFPEQITNAKEFWNWTRAELLQGLFPTKWYNGEPRKKDGFMVDGSSQMVGGARMRLLRIKSGKFFKTTQRNIEHCFLKVKFSLGFH